MVEKPLLNVKGKKSFKKFNKKSFGIHCFLGEYRKNFRTILKNLKIIRYLKKNKPKLSFLDSPLSGRACHANKGVFHSFLVASMRNTIPLTDFFLGLILWYELTFVEGPVSPWLWYLMHLSATVFSSCETQTTLACPPHLGHLTYLPFLVIFAIHASIIE